MEVPSISIETPDSDWLAVLDEYGAVIVEDFLSPEVLSTLNGEMDSLVANERSSKRGFVNPEIAAFFGGKVNHLAGVAGKSRGFVDHVLLHPVEPYLFYLDSDLRVHTGLEQSGECRQDRLLIGGVGLVVISGHPVETLHSPVEASREGEIAHQIEIVPQPFDLDGKLSAAPVAASEG